MGNLLLQNVCAEPTIEQRCVELSGPSREVADLGEYVAQPPVRSLQDIELDHDVPQAVRDGALGDRLLAHGLVNYDLELLGISDLQRIGLRGVWVVQVAHSQFDTVDFDMEGGICHRDDGDSPLRYAANGSDNL